MTASDQLYLWFYPIDWAATAAMLAAFAAIYTAYKSNHWAQRTLEATANVQLASIKMQNLDKVAELGSQLISLLTSNTMLMEAEQLHHQTSIDQVRELEDLKFKILLNLEKYPQGFGSPEHPDPISEMREVLKKLVMSTEPKERYELSSNLLARFAALVSVETDEISRLLASRNPR